MPANKNAMTRYKILDDLLSDRYRCFSLDDLTESVNHRLMDLGCLPVTRRMIEKDINYLEYGSEFMVEIERYSAAGKRCLRYMDPTYSIFKKKLTEDEKTILKALLSMVGQIQGLPEMQNLSELQKRLEVVPNQAILSLSENPLKDSTLFTNLYVAIAQKLVLRIEYHSHAHPEKPASIVAYPYLLKEYNRRWYLLCGAKTDGMILKFALDQIDDIEAVLGEEYKECATNWEEYFEDIVGVSRYANRKVEKILFWVSDLSSVYVQSKPIHDSQTVVHDDAELRAQYPNQQGGQFFRLQCQVNYELLRDLMSFGKELLVLEPEALRVQIQKQIQDNLEEYKKV